MSPLGALIELAARVGANGDAFIAESELNQWPPEAVSSLKCQKLITKAPPAISVVCPGCEEGCTLPVETIPAPSGAPALFVVCDKRDDTNRVAISANQLTQWQTSLITVAKFIGQCLSVRWNGTTTSPGDALQIGMVKSKAKSQMLCLRSDGGLLLMAGSSALPLVEVLTFAEGQYALDVQTIKQLIENSNTSDARYTPSNARREARKLETNARYEDWKKECRKLKKASPGMSDNWYAITISKMPIGNKRSPDTIRKNMK